MGEGCRALVAHSLGISDADNITVLVHRFLLQKAKPLAAVEDKLGKLELTELTPKESEGAAEKEEGGKETATIPASEVGEEEGSGPAQPQARLRSRGGGDYDDEGWNPTPSSRLSMIVSEQEEDDLDQWAGR